MSSEKAQINKFTARKKQNKQSAFQIHKIDIISVLLQAMSHFAPNPFIYYFSRQIRSVLFGANIDVVMRTRGEPD
jgi:hypothetical protein